MLELKPDTGFQLYVVAPVAFIVVLAPRHIAPAAGVAVIVGVAFTVTVAVAVLLQPLVVPVTV